MGIQKDAGELLLHIYKQYMASSQSEHFVFDFQMLFPDETLKSITGWDYIRIYRAIDYLKNRKLIDIFLDHKEDGKKYLVVKKILPDGIDIIEDKKKFKTTFNFELNLGFAKVGLSTET